jgi:hypothetical protein
MNPPFGGFFCFNTPGGAALARPVLAAERIRRQRFSSVTARKGVGIKRIGQATSLGQRLHCHLCEFCAY